MHYESFSNNSEGRIEEGNRDSFSGEKFDQENAEKKVEDAINAIYDSSEKDFIEPVMPKGIEIKVSSGNGIPNTGDVVEDVKDIMEGNNLAEISDQIEKYSQEYRKR